MQNQVKLIVKYQEIDKKLKLCEDELNGSEEAKKFFTARKFLQTVKDKLVELEQKAKLVTDNYNFALNEVKDLEKQIKDCEDLASGCQTEEELNSVKKKLDDLKAKVSQNEQKIDGHLKEINDLYREYADLGRKNVEMKAIYNEFGPKVQELKASKDKEMEEIKAELSKISKDINQELMNKYLSRRKDKKFPIVFGVDLSKNAYYCPRCATQLFAGFVSELKQGEIKECETCHMLVYGIDGSDK